MIGQAMDLCSQQLIASYPQQDDGKGTKKFWDLQEKGVNSIIKCFSKNKTKVKNPFSISDNTLWHSDFY